MEHVRPFVLLNTIIEHYEADSSHQPIQKRKNCQFLEHFSR